MIKAGKFFQGKWLFTMLLVVVLIQGTGGAAMASGDPEPRVIIVGGGLAGLVAAYELQNLGISAHILEANDYWGGRVVTADYGPGLKAEFGMHEVWGQDSLAKYVKNFKIPLSSPEQPFSSVLIDGKVYPYVQGSLDGFLRTIFTPAERKEYDRWLKEGEALYDEIEEKGLTEKLKKLQNLSFAGWMESMKLPPKVAEFLRLGLECEVAADWDRISAVYGIEQIGMFFHEPELCYHARGGNHTIIDAFVQEIKGPKTLGAHVTRIVRTKTPGGITECEVFFKKDNVMHSLKAEKVIVAVPYHTLHMIQMVPTLGDDQWKAIDALIPGCYTVVHFILDAAVGTTYLINGKNPFPVLTRGPLGVVYGFQDLPEPGQKELVFSLLIHGEYARSYLEPQDKIREKLLAELDKLWPGFSKAVHATYFYNYHPVAIPAWPPGHSPEDELHHSLRAENVGLYLAGDYIYTSHSEGAVESGRDVAKRIADALKK